MILLKYFSQDKYKPSYHIYRIYVIIAYSNCNNDIAIRRLLAVKSVQYFEFKYIRKRPNSEYLDSKSRIGGQYYEGI